MIIKVFKCDIDIPNQTIEGIFKSAFREYLALASDSASYVNMNYLLSEELDEDINIFDILDYASNYITIVREDDIAKANILDSVYYRDHNLVSLLKMIKYGNLQVRGLNILDDACNYALSQM